MRRAALLMKAMIVAMVLGSGMILSKTLKADTTNEGRSPLKEPGPVDRT
jgi:hypothetical protein